MRIDANQHFWDPDKFNYKWMPPGESRLRRSFLPPALETILRRNRFDGSVLVQANTLIEETGWLLELASDYSFIQGVVGWVDLTDRNLGATLDELQRHPKFKGVRHPVHDEADDRWLLRPDVLNGLRELARRGLPYDLLLRPDHLRLLTPLADAVPDLRMVIDHLAKPRIATGEIDQWARDIEAAAMLPQIWCKISGLITEAGPNWKSADLQPYVSHALRTFGPTRLMFGSDWPVCTTAGTWKEVLAAFTQSIGPQSMETRDRLLGESAIEFYSLCVSAPLR